MYFWILFLIVKIIKIRVIDQNFLDLKLLNLDYETWFSKGKTDGTLARSEI